MARAAFLLGPLAALLAGCSAKAPVVKEAAPFPLAFGAVHVVAEEEFEASVLRGLEWAGVPIAQTADDLAYLLKVELGGAQTIAGSCGQLRNARYTLHYAIVGEASAQAREARAGSRSSRLGDNVVVGATAVQIVGKGYDGSCQGNIFDEMGAALRRQLGAE